MESYQKKAKFDYIYCETGKEFIEKNHTMLYNNVKFLCWRWGMRDIHDIHDLNQNLFHHIWHGWSYEKEHFNEIGMSARISTYIFACIRNEFNGYVSKTKLLPETLYKPIEQVYAYQASENNHDDEIAVNMTRFKKYIKSVQNITKLKKTWLITTLDLFSQGISAVTSVVS
jgi:hypothetical protein